MASQEGPSGEGFAFKIGDLVLVKWNDGMVYFAKIKKIDFRRNKCIVVFDDKSNDEAHFSQIHSVDETTTDIICIKCKKDDSDVPNEIVLCDTCGIGFHQRCHNPPIPASALELDSPWNCFYCQKGTKCPFLTESLDVLQNLLSDDEQSKDADNESVATTESDQFDEGSEDYPARPTALKKRKFKGKRTFGLRRKRALKALSSSPEKQPPKPANLPSADSWRHKLAATDRPHAQADDISPDSGSDTGARKRKRAHQVGGNKRQKLPSVESHTVSVTRLPLPICDEGGTSPQPDQSHDPVLMEYSDAESTSPLLLANTKQEPPEPEPMRPRSLCVSLSFPEEIEPGSPFEKVVKASHKVGLLSPPKPKSPEVTQITTLPAWDEISTATPTSTSTTSLQSPVRTVPKSSNATAVASPPEAVDVPVTPMVATPLPRDAPPFPSLTKETPETDTAETETAETEGGSADASNVVTSPKEMSLASPPISPNKSADNVLGVSSNVIPSAADKKSVQSPISSPQVHEPITSVLTEQSKVPLQPQDEAASAPKQSVVPPQQVAKSRSIQPPSSAKPTTVVATVITPTLTQPSKVAASPVESGTSAARPFPQLVITTTSTPAANSTHTIVTQPPPKNAHKSSVDSVPASSLHITARATSTTSQSDPVSTQLVTSIAAMESVTKQPPAKTHFGVIASTKPAPPTLQSDGGQKTSARSQQTPNQMETQSTTIKSQLTQGQPTNPIAAVKTSVKRGQQKKTTTALLHHVSPISSPSVHKRQERQAHVRKSDVSTPPVQSLVSSAMSSVLASTVAEINGDVIITSIEKKHSTPVESARKPAMASSPVIPHTMPNFTSQGRPQDLYKGKISDSRAKKVVVARTVEIQPTAPTTSSYHTTASAPQMQGAGSIVTPIVSQTPVSVVQVVVSPPAYTPSGQEGQAAYFIPAVGQGGQQIAYAVPAGSVMPQYIIQDPPQYIPSNNSASPNVVVKPPVTPSTSVTYSQEASATYPYTLATPTQQPNVVYYTSAVPSTDSPSNSGKNTPVSGLSTTKPYAFVPALPSAEASKRGTPEHRVMVPHGQQIGGHPSIQSVRQVPGSQLLQQLGTSIPMASNTAAKAMKELVYVHQSAKATPRPSVATAYTTMTTGIKSAVKESEGGRRQQSTANAAVEIQEITKKIGEAFANCSEEKLISAFEDAWKKFQANERRYEALSKASSVGKVRHIPASAPIQSQIPPNVEVVSIPGTTSRLSLVRPTSARPKIIAPKATTSLHMPVSTPVATPSAGLPAVQDPQQYIYTYTTNTSQPQVLIQPVSSEYAIYTVAPKQAAQPQKSYQVQTAGLFYPSSGPQEVSSRGNVSNPAAPPQQIVIAQPAVQPHVQPKQPTPKTGLGGTHSAVTTALPMQQQQHHSRKNRDSATMSRRRTSSKSSRACALCGKEATYLCSGCHAEWYCGRQCQLAAWDAHSEHCKA